MKRRSYSERVNALQDDPIHILKTEHRMTLLRLESIERSLQYLEAATAVRVSEEGCMGEALRLKAALASLQHGLGLHFLKEESALFPVLADYIGCADGAIAAMVDEHARIRRVLGNLREKIADLCEHQGGERAPVFSGLTGLAYETIGLLRLHICKENQILFEICSVVLSEKEKRQIAEKIKSI